MPELPTGTVTFLFTDIEDSTPLVQQLGDRYADVQRDHQALLRAAWAAHDGVEVDTQGDSFFIAFSRAGDALAAAVDAQRLLVAHAWPEGAAVRVRMGLHTGTAQVVGDHYVGLDVHRTARIAAAGHGGQVLLSEDTRSQLLLELLRAHPEAARLRDMGTHRLKGLRAPEHVFQLVVPDLPTDFPPLQTVDVWPRVRAHLVPVAVLTLALLSLAGLLLSLVVATVPRALAGWTAATDLLLLVVLGVPTRVRRLVGRQWRAASKGLSAAFSVLLSLVIVVTVLFITKPAIFLAPKHLGYDFSYTYHAPTHKGGTVTVGLVGPLGPLSPGVLGGGGYVGLGNGCVTHLPDTTLGLAGYKPDQCTEVPTIAHGGESPDGKTTTFHIDPRAVWSDGTPITADDFLFAYHLLADPNIAGGFPVNQIQQLTALDARTVRIDWSVDFAEYLEILTHSLLPVPFHAYATGKFAGVYDPKSGAYNSALAQQLVASPSFNAALPVDNGPFTVQSIVPNQTVLVRNPRFFSNFFHAPALDRVTFLSVNPQWPQGGPPFLQSVDTLIADYRQGTVDLVDQLNPVVLSRLGGFPKAQVITSPLIQFWDIGFNQRSVAPNAQANGGVSIFADRNVRKAFVEAFDRCAAVRAQLGAVNCTDPNLFTDEPTTPPAPDYDPSVKLPGYNPIDAARLMYQAGYPVVDGIRRNKDGKTPLQVTIDTWAAGPLARLIGRRMQQDYAQNLKIGVTLVSPPDFFGGTFTSSTGGGVWKGTFDIALYGDLGAPALVWNAQFILGPTDTADIPSAQNPAGGNFLGVVDPWVVTQEQLGAETLDYDQRVNVFREVKGHIAQQFYLEPVFINADVALVRPTLCNFKKWPFPGDNAWNMADWFVAPSCP